MTGIKKDYNILLLALLILAIATAAGSVTYYHSRLHNVTLAYDATASQLSALTANAAVDASCPLDLRAATAAQRILEQDFVSAKSQVDALTEKNERLGDNLTAVQSALALTSEEYLILRDRFVQVQDALEGSQHEISILRMTQTRCT